MRVGFRSFSTRFSKLSRGSEVARNLEPEVRLCGASHCRALNFARAISLCRPIVTYMKQFLKSNAEHSFIVRTLCIFINQHSRWSNSLEYAAGRRHASIAAMNALRLAHTADCIVTSSNTQIYILKSPPTRQNYACKADVLSNAEQYLIALTVCVWCSISSSVDKLSPTTYRSTALFRSSLIESVTLNTIQQTAPWREIIRPSRPQYLTSIVCLLEILM